MRLPRFWLITAAALVGIGVTLSLGRWQLDRAAQKEALQATVEGKKVLGVLDNRSFFAIKSIVNEVHRPARLQGRWLPQHTVFLDNRQMNGRPGFYVVTPFRLEGGAASVPAVLLVQRGWVPRHFLDRTQLPAVDTPAGLVTVEGRIAPAPSQLYAFKGADTGPIRQNLGLAAFGDEIRQPLLPVTVLQTGPGGDGLQREWPQANAGTDKHYGYAFQWFGLSGLMAILYVWFQFVRPRRLPR